MGDAEDDLMTTDEVAGWFRTKPSTVRFWRSTGYGPVGHRVGKRVLYSRSEVERFWHSVTEQKR